MRYYILAAALTICGLCHGQQKTFGYVPAGTQSYRLASGGLMAYGPFKGDQKVRLTVSSKLAIKLGFIELDNWNAAQQTRNMQYISRATAYCLQQDVLSTEIECALPFGFTQYTLVIIDGRTAGGTFLAAVAASLGITSPLENAISDNAVSITAYNWACTANCNVPDPPVYNWIDLVKEKFVVDSGVKAYGPFKPGTLRLKLKSPTRMLVAALPAADVERLRSRPGDVSLLSKSRCKQTGVQDLEWDCTLSSADGEMQIVVLPEGSAFTTKKANLKISTVACVSNCGQ